MNTSEVAGIVLGTIAIFLLVWWLSRKKDRSGYTLDVEVDVYYFDTKYRCTGNAQSILLSNLPKIGLTEEIYYSAVSDRVAVYAGRILGDVVRRTLTQVNPMPTESQTSERLAFAVNIVSETYVESATETEIPVDSIEFIDRDLWTIYLSEIQPSILDGAKAAGIEITSETLRLGYGYFLKVSTGMIYSWDNMDTYFHGTHCTTHRMEMNNRAGSSEEAVSKEDSINWFKAGIVKHLQYKKLQRESGLQCRLSEGDKVHELSPRLGLLEITPKQYEVLSVLTPEQQLPLIQTTIGHIPDMIIFHPDHGKALAWSGDYITGEQINA